MSLTSEARLETLESQDTGDRLGETLVDKRAHTYSNNANTHAQVTFHSASHLRR
jgi:hypothetical protein